MILHIVLCVYLLYVYVCVLHSVLRQKMERDDVQYPGHHDNDPVYGNVEVC